MSELKCKSIHDIIAQLYISHAQAVVSFLQQFIRNRHICEELVHDAFEKMLLRTESLETCANKLKNLLYTIAKNKALDYLKRCSIEHRKLRQIVTEELYISQGFYQSIEDAHVEGEVLSTLYDTIDSFSEISRSIIVKHYFENKSTLFLSREMNMSPYKIRRLRTEATNAIAHKLLPYSSTERE